MDPNSARVESPLARLDNFLANKYPAGKALRVVHTTYSGLQQCKSVPINHVRLLAAGASTVRPGDEAAFPDSNGNAIAADERGVIAGNPAHHANILLTVDDTGLIDRAGMREGEMTIQIDWSTLYPNLVEPQYGYEAGVTLSPRRRAGRG